MPAMTTCSLHFDSGYTKFAKDHRRKKLPEVSSPGDSPAETDDDVLDFNILVPCTEPKGNKWYRKHWGTDWNAVDPIYEEDIEFDDLYDSGGVFFRTKGSYPDKWVDALIKKYPEAEFTMCYAGDASSDPYGIVVRKAGVTEFHENDVAFKKNIMTDVFGYEDADNPYDDDDDDDGFENDDGDF